jgi:hypothetical protein
MRTVKVSMQRKKLYSRAEFIPTVLPSGRERMMKMFKQYAAIAGRLCFDLYPETGSELKAIEKRIEMLANEIDFKVSGNISAATDIEFHSLLQLCRAEYINAGKEFADEH